MRTSFRTIQSPLIDLPDTVQIQIENESEGETRTVALHRVGEELCWLSETSVNEPAAVALYDAGRGRAGLRLGGGDSFFEIMAHDNAASPSGILIFERFFPTHIDDLFLHRYPALPAVRALVRLDESRQKSRRGLRA